MVDPFNPRFALGKDLEMVLDTIVDPYGTVRIADVSGINISDAEYAMQIAHCQQRLRPTVLGFFTGKQDRMLFVRPYAHFLDNDFELHPAAPEQSNLLFIFSYTRHPTDGLVDIAYQYNFITGIRFASLYTGLAEMSHAHKVIREAVNNYAQGYGRDHTLAEHWLSKDPMVKAKLVPLTSRERNEIEKREGSPEAIRRNFEHSIYLAHEFGQYCYMLRDGSLVERRRYCRRPEVLARSL